MAAYKTTVQPATEPVDAATCKLQARIDSTAEDALLAIYIQAAREACEQIIGRPLITQTIARVSDDWPDDDDIELLRAPVQSITSITYLDADGASQTASTALYTLDNADEHGPAWVLLQDGQTWPTLGDYGNAVTVTFVAGYGAASSVPAAIKQWILLAVAHMFENRAASVPQDFGGALLDRYRLWA